MTVYLERGYNRKEYQWSKTVSNTFQRRIAMIYVGIDVAKDKHDCFITNSDGEVLFKAFTIANNLDGFNELYQNDNELMTLALRYDMMCLSRTLSLRQTLA